MSTVPVYLHTAIAINYRSPPNAIEVIGVYPSVERARRAICDHAQIDKNCLELFWTEVEDTQWAYDILFHINPGQPPWVYRIDRSLYNRLPTEPMF